MDELIAAELIVRARRASGLTQIELAARAGLRQSVISDYERGRREPSLSTLRHIIEATGHHLSLELTATTALPPELPDTAIARRLARRRLDVLRIARQHGAHNVRLFGSVARGDEHAGSDVDLLVDLDPDVGLIELNALNRELSELLGADVDVVPADQLKAELHHVLSESVTL